jgi:hypothetical protein
LSVGRAGEPYPEAIRQIEGRSGCYMIRCGRRVFYVGESHTGNLRKTMTRHFQGWGRSSGKTFWERMYGRQNDPGTTYERERCQVALYLTRPEDAKELEGTLIARFRPADNLADVPF